MAMTMKAEGMDEVSAMLADLGDAAQGIAAASLYDGAGVMADAITAGIASIRTEPFRYATDGRKRLPSPEEKALLTRKSGISKFRKNGSDVSTSVGMDNAGYGMLVGKKKPVPQIANAINSGTSFMQKQPFFRRAVNGASGPAVEAIAAKAEQMINEISKS